jgi:plastocyanin
MGYAESPRDPAEQARGSRRLSRRAVLVGVMAGFAGCTSGILDDPSFPEADVIAAPDNELVFEPDELTVSTGETVRWGFASGGHNVSCRPGDADAVVLPDGAAPFASYGPEQDPEVTLVSRGETYEHTFEVAGQYTYLCVPHADAGMVGTINVE